MTIIHWKNQTKHSKNNINGNFRVLFNLFFLVNCAIIKLIKQNSDKAIKTPSFGVLLCRIKPQRGHFSKEKTCNA